MLQQPEEVEAKEGLRGAERVTQAQRPVAAAQQLVAVAEETLAQEEEEPQPGEGVAAETLWREEAERA